MLDALQFEPIRYAVYAGLLASIACGIIGTYVVVNRIVFISGGISHASFGGVGLGYLAGFSPVLGALVFTLVSALGIGIITRKTRLPADTAIGVMWAIGMALGIILIDLSPGYAPDLRVYLFGNILLVPFSDIILMIILDAVIVTIVIALYKEFLALSFDEEFGTVAGIPVERLYLLLLCMIALTVVLLIRVVGIILVIALLTIPATIARQFTYDLRKMMLLAVAIGAILSFGGLWLSYEFDLASGATIILLSGTALIMTLGLSRLRSRTRVRHETMLQVE
ncbi:MAG: metal ABC transporter permease [Dehalococcoidia bacterium]|nr:MAG: metal ABC transporter permease [Dehalococcoidia bacterium]